jgi:putative SOS response-associated peptidase YedK
MEKVTDGKQPCFAQTQNKEPLFFEGLYEYARGNIPASCTIIPLPASEALASLHHRMPVMFSTPQDWLQKGTFEHAIASLQWQPVDKAVNNTRNQG